MLRCEEGTLRWIEEAHLVVYRGTSEVCGESFVSQVMKFYKGVKEL